jgi:hypothetical protein
MVDLHVVEGEMDKTTEEIKEAVATEEASTTIISKRRLKQAEYPVKECSRLTSSLHKQWHIKSKLVSLLIFNRLPI